MCFAHIIWVYGKKLLQALHALQRSALVLILSLVFRFNVFGIVSDKFTCALRSRDKFPERQVILEPRFEEDVSYD